ncbi:MAG: addiction module antidote protein [Methylocystis sp.]
MAIETTPWDSAELLDTPEAVAAYIEAAFEDGDPALITHALAVAARAKGMARLALESGVTLEALHEALAANGDPKLSTFLSVLKGLGLRVVVQAA